MTRHSSEENSIKSSDIFPETKSVLLLKSFENITNPLENNSTLPYDLSIPSVSEQEVGLTNLNNDLTRITEKHMINLYNLENKVFQKNNIKIDFDIDLYQMEDY